MSSTPPADTDECLSDEAAAAILTGDRVEVLEAAYEHAEHCDACRVLLAALARARGSARTMERLVSMFAAETTTADAPAVSRATAVPWPPGTRLGRYVLGPRIGAGGMGVVHRGHDPELQRDVAIKIVRLEGRRPEAREAASARLIREGRALARLSHPNVLPIYDVGALDDRVYIALELVDGCTLAQWLRERPRSWPEVVACFVEAGRGLVAAHAAHIVHRDFKPDNVLIDKAGRVRVTDFGLARLDGLANSEVEDLVDLAGDDSLTRTGVIMGTPCYMAPEQHDGAAADARSDQFAYCVALFEGVYGVRPFDGHDLGELAAKKAAESIRPPQRTDARVLAVPSALDAAIRLGLRADPDRRWPGMAELVTELERLLRRAGPRRWLVALGSVAIAAAAWAARPMPGPCDDAHARLAGVWDPARSTALAEAFADADTPAAAHAWTSARERLDRYAVEWTAAYRDACGASGGEPEGQLDARMLCLRRRSGQLRAAVDTLLEGDRGTVHRVSAVLAGLEPIDGCSRDDALDPRVPEDPELARHVEAVRERIADAAARSRAGRYALAVQLAREVARSAADLGFEPLVLEARSRLGHALVRTDPREAEAELEDVYHASRRLGLDAMAFHAAEELAFVIGGRLARVPDGLEWIRHAEAMLARLPPSPRWQADLWAEHAVLLGVAGSDEAAERTFRAALDLYAREDPSGAAALAARNNLAGLISQRGRYDEALVEHFEVLRGRIALLGPSHPDVAASLVNIAGLLAHTGDYPAAFERLAEAEPIVVATEGERGIAMAQLLSVRAQALLNAGDPAAARAVLRRRLEIATEVHASESVEIADAWNMIGVSWSAEDQLDDAEAAFRRAIELFSKGDPPVPRWLLPVRANLASVVLRRGRPEEAEVELREVLAELEPILGAGNPEIVPGYVLLGWALLEQGRAAEALPIVERALELQRKRTDAPADLAILHYLQARARWDLGRDRPQMRAQARAAAAALDENAANVAEAREVERWLATLPPE